MEIKRKKTLQEIMRDTAKGDTSVYRTESVPDQIVNVKDTVDRLFKKSGTDNKELQQRKVDLSGKPIVNAMTYGATGKEYSLVNPTTNANSTIEDRVIKKYQENILLQQQQGKMFERTGKLFEDIARNQKVEANIPNKQGEDLSEDRKLELAMMDRKDRFNALRGTTEQTQTEAELYAQEIRNKKLEKDVNKAKGLTKLGGAVVYGGNEFTQNAVSSFNQIDTALNSVAGRDEDNSKVKFSQDYAGMVSKIGSDIEDKYIKALGIASEGIGQQAPQLLLNGTGAGALIGGVSEFATTYNEMMNENPQNKDKAVLTGALKGTVAGTLEHTMGLFGGSKIDKLTTKELAQVKNRLVRNIMSTGYDTLGEITEEELENVVGYVIDKVVNNKDITWEEVLSETKETAKQTGLTTLLMSVLGLGGNTRAEVNNLANRNAMIDLSNLTKNQKNDLKTLAQNEKISNDQLYKEIKKVEKENNLQDKIISNAIQENSKNQDTTIKNKTVLNQEQQTISNEQENSQNGMSEQISNNSQNVQKNIQNITKNENLSQNNTENYQTILDEAKYIPQSEKDLLLKDAEEVSTSTKEFKEFVNQMNELYKEQDNEILDTNKTYSTGRKETYTKYMGAKNEYDTTAIEKAKQTIQGSKRAGGRRTKSQWLQVANMIGAEIANKSNQEIEEIAYRTWQDERPNAKSSINREGQNYVAFTSDEWINAIYNSVKQARGNYNIDLKEKTEKQTNLLPYQQVTSKDDMTTSAKKYGLKYDNISIQNIQKALEKRGIKARFDESYFSSSRIGALYSTNREIIFNPNANAKTIIQEMAVHELTHDLIASKTETSKELRDSVLSWVKKDADYKELRKTVEQAYKEAYKDKTPEQFKDLIDEEIVAKTLQKKFGTQEEVNRLAREDRNFAQRIYDFIVDKIDSFKNRKDAEYLYWKDIQKKFEKAFNENDFKEVQDTKFSIVEATKTLQYKTDSDLKSIYKRFSEKVDEMFKNKEDYGKLYNYVLAVQDELEKRNINTDKIYESRYSIDTTDNQGRTLSKEQQEYFKESKVRDDNARYDLITDAVTREELNGKPRKHLQSIYESDQIGQTGKEVAKELYTKDTYIPISNASTLATVNDNIQRNGLERTYESFMNKLGTNERVSLNDIATGERLIQIYSQNGDVAKVNDLIQNVAILGTELGQQVQALSLIKKASPEGQLQFLNKIIDRTNAKEGTNLKITDDMAEQILQSRNQEELQENIADIAEAVANDLPLKTSDKIRSWRYLSMLGNPRTHIRNVVANVAMNLTQNAKNVVAGGIEDVASVFNNELERTKTLKLANKEQVSFAKQDAEVMQDMIDGGGKYDIKNLVQASTRQFDNNTLNAIAEFNSNLLDIEDKIFLKKAYQQAMQGYMSANNLKASDMQGEVLERARQYSSIQAQEATFHQFSALAQQISAIENKGGLTGVAVGAILPFKKTPINIAKTGIQYSPVGIAQSLAGTINDITKGTQDLQTKLKEGKITEAQYKSETSQMVTKRIDQMAKGLTGTAIALIGYALAKNGILRAGNDKDDDQFKDELGNQQYSIKIGDNTFTLDWLAPSAMPLFVGATIHDLVTGEMTDEGINAVITGLSKTFEPMTEMSMIQGLTSAISSYEQGSSNMVFDIATSAGTSYVGQFIPTAVGQITKTIDPYVRDTSSTKTGIAKKVDQLKNQTMSKLPVLSNMLPTKQDIWGKDKTRSENVILRYLENAVLPYNREKVQEDITSMELESVFDDTGEKGVLPTRPQKYLTINKEQYRFTNEEYSKAKSDFGKTSKNILDELIKTSGYKKMTNEQKVKIIENVYSYAKEKIKSEYAKQNNIEYNSENDMYNTINKLELNGESVKGYINYLSETINLKTSDEKINYLQKMNISDNTKRIIYENDISKGKYVSEYKDNTYETLSIIAGNKVSNEYLNYKQMNFEADKDKNGNSISGSKKQKVINYINSVSDKMSMLEREYIMVKEGYASDLNQSQRNQLRNALEENKGNIEKETYESLIKKLNKADK